MSSPELGSSWWSSLTSSPIKNSSPFSEQAESSSSASRQPEEQAVVDAKPFFERKRTKREDPGIGTAYALTGLPPKIPRIGSFSVEKDVLLNDPKICNPTTGILTLPDRRSWIYDEKEFEMLGNPLGAGDFTQTRGFSPDQMVEFNVRHQIASDQLAMKIVNPLTAHKFKSAKASKKAAETFKNIAAAYHYLTHLPHKYRIPVAKLYASPENLINPKTNQTDLQVYLVERMTADSKSKMTQWKTTPSIDALPKEERALLKWVKSWIVKMAIYGHKHNKELINDFKPANIMLDAESQPRLVDYSLPENGWAQKLEDSITAWSCGNKVIYDYLIDVSLPGREATESREAKAAWNLKQHLQEIDFE